VLTVDPVKSSDGGTTTKKDAVPNDPERSEADSKEFKAFKEMQSFIRAFNTASADVLAKSKKSNHK